MSDLRIVMVGKTGAGKSASANTILRQEVFEEDISSESVTKQCQQHKLNVEGRNISVIDTPGLEETSISDEQLKNELVKCVAMSLPGPHVFLLVIRLDVRFTDEEKNAVKWIQKNFGEDAEHYTIILFTRGDQLKKKSIETYLTNNKQINELVKQCKGGYIVFNNTDKENQQQVNDLLQKIDRMVMENRGQHYTSDMYKKAQRKIEEEQKRRQEEEEIQKKEKEEKIRQDERRKTMLIGTGATAAVGGGVLAVATGGVAVPAALVVGGAALAGGGFYGYGGQENNEDNT